MTSKSLYGRQQVHVCVNTGLEQAAVTETETGQTGTGEREGGRERTGLSNNESDRTAVSRQMEIGRAHV